MSYKYDNEFVKDNLMGPNAMKILKEMSESFELNENMRVLDLGCGKGLTSIFLANEFNVNVFAVDLWITATENYNRFQKYKLDNQIIPLQLDATNLPFPNEYFDAVISVDAYHYFGNNDIYLEKYLAPLLKKGGTLAIGIPGLKKEINVEIPNEMRPYWNKEVLTMWHSKEWWNDIFMQSESIETNSLKEMKCFDDAWNDWLSCENEFALGDREMLKVDGGKYMNLISIIGKKI